ncbi:beta-ketoacyl-ACP synthase II [Rouxiella sp. T17]|uniref:beta-ketoacyl-ACP synthase II n=1 Tax=Rouxiella sp. T17 TaxID=3085684 RepID=UPI002FCA07EB
MTHRRVVITGMGAVSPLGCDIDTIWQRLLAGQSGIRVLPTEISETLTVKIGGQVQTLEQDPESGFDPDQYVLPKDQKKMDRFILFAMAAADKAIAESGWKAETAEQQERSATVIGSGIGGFPAIANAVRTNDTRGPKRLSPFTIPSFLVNLAAGQVSIKHQFKGPIGAPVTACAAGVQAIGDAVRLIRNDEADIALCGGAEATIDTVTLGSFAAAKAMSAGHEDHPEKASRPFDSARDGFVMGEGAGMLVIEELEHALARGAKPLAEIIGYGTSGDAYHMTSGAEDGNGAGRAMKIALRQGGIKPEQVDHLNAHATSTPVGDLGEINAIKNLFGTGDKLAVTSTKSATGHLLGAAGGLETIFTVLAVRDQIVPPTLNLDNKDPAAEGLNIIGNKAQPHEINYALSNGFGFGGVNACVLLKRWEA